VVHPVRLVIARGSTLQLRLEARALLDGIVELTEAVGHLAAAGVEFEPLDRVRVVRLLLGERRDFGREVVDERRLNELVFPERFEDRGRDPAGAVRRLDLDAERRGY